MSGVPTIFLVDDDPSVLRAISRMVRSAGWNVAAFASPQAFLAQPVPDEPGCIMLDLTMPGLNGLEVQQELVKSGNRLPILFLTGNGDIPASVRAMKAGALDFLSKPCAAEDLLAALRLALERDRELRTARQETAAVSKLLSSLTPREHEVMLGVAAGQMNKQIAAELGTSVKTIKTHRGRVMAKLRVGSVAELVRLTERAGITPPE